MIALIIGIILGMILGYHLAGWITATSEFFRNLL
jgi:ABC-type dipeptide/oligopeptide/nickel transport system permease subunit